MYWSKGDHFRIIIKFKLVKKKYLNVNELVNIFNETSYFFYIASSLSVMYRSNFAIIGFLLNSYKMYLN